MPIYHNGVFTKTDIMKQARNPFILFILLTCNVYMGYASPLDTVHGNSATTAYYQNYVINNGNPILIMLDSLAQQKYMSFSNFTSDRNVLNIYNFEPGFVPRYTHEEYKSRLDKLNEKSPFPFVYNDEVRGFIDLYAVRRANLTARMLGLAEMYFPLFEEYLDKYNIPVELKYLAVIESALNPKAVSPVGASGLWQFMYNTGKVYGLKVDSYVDDRYDPIKETDAACRYLKYLHSLFNDWALVIAAYNTGEGNVLKAIRRAGGSFDFWTVMKYLPQETRSYVPAFIAVNYVMNHAAKHNIFPTAPDYKYWELDTVKISQHVRFSQLTEVLHIKHEDLQLLNPAYKKCVIPGTIDKTYVLTMPRKYIREFVQNESLIYNFKTQKEINDTYFASIHNFSVRGKETYLRHIVQEGESLKTIATKYNCSTTDLVNWNRMKQQNISTNQTILIKVDSTTANIDTVIYNRIVKNLETTTSNTIASQHNENQNTKNVITTVKPIKHTVKRGESMGIIASKYKISVAEIKKYNNLRSSTIFPGQKLIVKKITETKMQTTHTAIVQTSPKPIPTSNTTSKPKTHTVKSGETLLSISRQHNCSLDDLKSWNNIKGSVLHVNQQLIIKASVTELNDTNSTEVAVAQNNQSESPKETTTKEVQKTNPTYIYHTVQRGDTLWSIAQRYKTLTPTEIKAINKIQNPSDLKVGQKIKVGISG